MGGYGCAWVRWDPGDTGEHKNKASRGKNGRTAHDLGTMAGEISPDIMFWEGGRKVARMGAGG